MLIKGLGFAFGLFVFLVIVIAGLFGLSLILGGAWNLFAPSVGLPALDVLPAFGLTVVIAIIASALKR